MALLECSVFEVFFGGARGGGKTDGMLGEWANHADRYGEHAIGLMLRSPPQADAASAAGSIAAAERGRNDDGRRADL
jgi:hypothetical protein